MREENFELTAEEQALLDQKPGQLTNDDRKRRRQLQNRIAAQESRGRKRQYASLLENKSSTLEQQLSDATKTISDLRNRVDELTMLLHRQAGVKAPYHYDPRAAAQSMVSLPMSVHTSGTLSGPGSAMSLTPSPSHHEAAQPVDAVRSLPMNHARTPMTEAKAVLAPRTRWSYPSMTQHKLKLPHSAITDLFTPTSKIIQDAIRPTGQLLMTKLNPYSLPAHTPSPTPSQRSSTVPSPSLKADTPTLAMPALPLRVPVTSSL